MVDSQLADRLLPHCGPGLVLDLLAGSATAAGTTALRAAPSDTLTARLLRGADVARATRLIAAVSSPQLLLRLAGSERRAGVLRGLAANPHLPAEAIALLADRAEKHSDEVLAAQLISGRTQRQVAELLLERPMLRRLVSDWSPTLAYALRNAGDEQLLLQAADELSAPVLWDVLEALTRFDPVGSPDVLLTLAVAAQRREAGPGVRPHVVKALLTDDVTAAVQRRALTELGWPEVRRRLLTLIGVGNSPLTVTDVLAGVQATQMGQLVHGLAEVGIVVDMQVAELIDVPGVPASVHSRLRTTPGAAERLATSANVPVAAVHLLRLPDAAQRIPFAAPEIRDALQPSAAQLADLSAAGLPDEWLTRFARKLLAQPFAAIGPELRQKLLTAAPEDVLRKLELTVDDVDALLARPDVGELPYLLLFILKEVELPGPLRRRCAAALPAGEVLTWLRYWQRTNRTEPGDLAWLVEQAPDRDVLIEGLAAALITGGHPAWTAEAITVVPLNWATVTSEDALRALVDFLDAAFGDDLEVWTAALSLLPTWVGTVTQLVETTRAVLDAGR